MSGAGRRRAIALLASGSCATAGACARGPSDGPPVVHFGEDACAACTMIVSEQRFAAAIVPDDGRGDPLPFDDIGCLFAWEARNPDAPVRARWVHDHGGSEWVHAETAWYVRSPELRSPMGSGVAARAEEAGARELRDERGGDVLDWDALREAAARSPLVVPPGSAAQR